MGIFGVALFALAVPALESFGVVLPILIAADVVAVKYYHHRASWPHLWRLFPWAILGIILGYLGLKHIDDKQAQHLIGFMILLILGFQWWRQRKHLEFDQIDEALPHNIWLTASMGILAGMATMANAAGPIMILYLLAMRLPKMVHIGTGAWYYLILNSFKVPFFMSAGLITKQSFLVSAALIPVAMVAALCGRRIVNHIDEQLFNRLAFGSAFIAALYLAGLPAAIYSLASKLSGG